MSQRSPWNRMIRRVVGLWLLFFLMFFVLSFATGGFKAKYGTEEWKTEMHRDVEPIMLTLMLLMALFGSAGMIYEVILEETDVLYRAIRDLQGNKIDDLQQAIDNLRGEIVSLQQGVEDIRNDIQALRS